MRRKMLFLALLLLSGTAAALLLLPVRPGANRFQTMMNTDTVPRLDMSAFSAGSPGRPIHLLFIHHSCGGQLFAAPGPDQGANCIYRTHPEGGGLRALLEQSSYRVHEASYGSRVGDRTDIFDWPPKFRTQMAQVLRCDLQDTLLPEGQTNEVVVFKSCFPNNQYSSEGDPPGNPAGPELTVWNAKAAYLALLEEFRKQPNVLFVCMSAPPLAPNSGAQRLWKVLAKKALGRPMNSPAASAPLARKFNNWLGNQDGWLKDYPLKNVVVFDLYDVLTGDGQSDLSAYPTGKGYDSHPNRSGNLKAAEAFVPFLNRAVRRARLSETSGSGAQTSQAQAKDFGPSLSASR